MNRLSRSPRFAGLMLLAMLLFAVGVISFVTSRPARAEENLGEHSFVTEEGSHKYTTYIYPNLNQAFFLPNDYETRFDIHNAKFFYLEFHEWAGEQRGLMHFQPTLMEIPHSVMLKFDVAFYTPRGELVHEQHMVRPNWWFVVPQNGTSLAYDRLQVRIRNHSQVSRDFRFIVMDPTDAVKGTPIPSRRDVNI